MRCNAMMFNLDQVPSTKKPGVFNHFLTFVDVDTGESFRTWIPPEQSAYYKKMAQYSLTLSLTVGEFNGQPQMNCRILAFDPPNDTVFLPLADSQKLDTPTGEVLPKNEDKPEDKTAFPFKKAG